jgi:hypothetical protein
VDSVHVNHRAEPPRSCSPAMRLGIEYRRRPAANTAHRGAIKELVVVADIRSRLRFRDGNTPGAIDDVLAAMAAARHLSGDGTLASVLFAYKLENSITGILVQNLYPFSSAQLHELVAVLTSCQPVPTLVVLLRQRNQAATNSWLSLKIQRPAMNSSTDCSMIFLRCSRTED